MIWVGVGGSRGLDAAKVAKEATQRSLNQLGKKRSDLLLVFCSPRLDQKGILKGILSLTGEVPLIGASIAQGFIGMEPQDLVVVSLVSDSLTVKAGVGRGLHQNARQAGQEAAWAVNRQPDDRKGRFYIAFPDGLTGNGSDLVRGLQEVLGTSFPMIGGAAADAFRFQRAYQYFSDEVMSDAVTGALFLGEVSFAVSCRHGWLPLGRAWEVTKARGNLLEELDGRAASMIYEAYFADQLGEKGESLARISSLYPLGISLSPREEMLIRYPLQIGPGGSLICTADIPQGVEVHLMIGTKESFLEAARQALEQLFQSLPPKRSKLLLMFESASRARLFGRDYLEELRLVERLSGGSVPWVSLHGFGELCPPTEEERLGQSQYLNESLTLLALGD